MSNERIAARFLVRGRVQGVGFRAATRREAQTRGIHGFARNLDDGRVEVWAEGEAQLLAELERWLARGPGMAQVTEVQRIDVEPAGRSGFGVG